LSVVRRETLYILRIKKHHSKEKKRFFSTAKKFKNSGEKMNTLKRSFGFRTIKGLAEFSKLKRAVTRFISILMRKLFIVKHGNMNVFIPLQM